MHHQKFNSQQFYVLPTQLYLCVLCESQNKQRLFPYAILIHWFYNRFNTLQPSSHYMHRHQFKIQQLYVLPTLNLCVLYLSDNKQ